MRTTSCFLLFTLASFGCLAQPNHLLPLPRQVLLTEQIVSTTLIANESPQKGYVQSVPEGDRMEFLSWINGLILAGELTAYKHPEGIPTKEKQYALSIEAYKDIIFRKDTLYYVPDTKTKEVKMQIVSMEVFPKHVNKIDCVESWIYDTGKRAIQKKVLAIGPGMDDLDELTGEFKGFRNLFWVWLEE